MIAALTLGSGKVTIRTVSREKIQKALRMIFCIVVTGREVFLPFGSCSASNIIFHLRFEVNEHLSNQRDQKNMNPTLIH
jgi:hypothetical protein